jgi:hypothetical protein
MLLNPLGLGFLILHECVDEQDYNDGSQNDHPIGDLNARYRCFPAKPFHDFRPQIGRLSWRPQVSPHAEGATDDRYPARSAAFA